MSSSATTRCVALLRETPSRALLPSLLFRLSQTLANACADRGVAPLRFGTCA